MPASIRSLIIPRVIGAVAAVWACSGGAAWAGDADLASLQSIIDGLCTKFGMTTASCPQLPTVTQAVLEAAGLGNNLPEMLRAQNNIPPGSGVTAGNAAAVPTCPNIPMPFPLDATTVPQLFGTTATTCRNGNTVVIPGLLTTLTPLAFISQNSATTVNALGVKGTGQATQLYDTSADTFLYAVGVSARQDSNGFVANNLTDPDTVFFFYEDLLRNNQNFNNGQVVAKFQLPLTVLNGQTESQVNVTLNFTANSARDCSASTVTGNFPAGVSGNGTLMASQIGIKCAVRFSASPISASPHAIFEVAVPLLVTGACSPTPCTPSPNTDPAYFYSLFNGVENKINTGVYTAFNFNDLGGTTDPAVWPAAAGLIGLAPTALPLCTSTTCPSGSPPPPPPPGSITFSLCASLPNNTNGNGAQLRPAVGAYHAMATSGEMFLSAPLPAAFANSLGVPPPVCNPL